MEKLANDRNRLVTHTYIHTKANDHQDNENTSTLLEIKVIEIETKYFHHVNLGKS